jgi:transposase
MKFLACDREQTFLMSPDPRDWLPEDHLVWFVLAAVEEMGLDAFYGSYCQDGWGRAAFEPSMVVALLMYAYARGERSSRGIERRCAEDVAFRVIAVQQTPDHATIARFRVRHEAALAGLFSEVLGLCRESGLVKVGVIAIDGTKVHANASYHSNLDYEQLAREILKEAGEVDAAEDALYGEARGDELPEHLRTREGRRAALREAKEKLARERAGNQGATVKVAEVQCQEVKLVFDPEAIVARVQGREGWVCEARHQLDEHRWLQAQPIPRSRSERLLECERRLQENLRVEREAYEHHRATARTKDGRCFGARPNPYVAPELPPGKINVTDLDSRNVKTPRSYTQGYNVRAVVNEQQIDQVVSNGTQVLIPPDAGKHERPRRGWTGGRYAFMRTVLAGDIGAGLYRKRKAMVEPVFAQTSTTGASTSSSGEADPPPRPPRLVQLGSHRHARIHDGALVSDVRRRRRLMGHLLLSVTPPAPRL